MEETVRFDVLTRDDRSTIRVVGDLDVGSGEELTRCVEQVLAGRDNEIVLDLTPLRFIDSSGVRAVLRANERCRTRGRTVRVVPGGPMVDRVFSILGVKAQLDFVTPGDGHSIGEHWFS